MRYFLFFLLSLLLSCQTDSLEEKSFSPHVVDTVWGEDSIRVRSVELNTSKRELFFNKRLENNLETVYRTLENEMAFCLHGNVKEDTIFVHEASIPRIMGSTDSTATVDSGVCKRRGNYLGLIHNHNDVMLPFCRPSETDLRRFSLDREAEIEVIVCRKNGLVSFYVLTKNKSMYD